jgi:O-antigen/teichoic acid export membrane protein
MIGASVVQLVGTTMIPIILFLLLDDLMEIFIWVGISSIGIMLFGFVWRNNGIRILKVNIVYYMDLVIYGLNRIPSIIAQFILLAGLPIMIAKTSNLENVAYFNSSLSLLNLSLLITHPIGMVLLPRISRKLARGKIDEISYGLKLALYGGIYFSMMFGIWIFIFAPIILELWLGQIGNIGSLILRGIIISLPFYTIAGLARSPIDAASYKGYNSIIYGIAAIFVVVSYYLGVKSGYHPLYVAITSFVGGQIIAGVSSIIILNKFFNIRIWNLTLIRDVVMGMFLVISGYYLMLILGLNRLIIACSIFIFGITIFNYYYKNTKGGWVYDFRKLIE